MFSGFSDVPRSEMHKTRLGQRPKDCPKMKIFSTLGLQSLARCLKFFAIEGMPAEMATKQGNWSARSYKPGKLGSSSIVQLDSLAQCRVQYKSEAITQRKGLFSGKRLEFCLPTHLTRQR